jgi:hypothetical protein
MTLKAHFDGKQIVLDEPAPAGLAPNTPVTVVFENGTTESALEKIAKLAIETDDLPVDYSEQHDHYVKGTPRR